MHVCLLSTLPKEGRSVRVVYGNRGVQEGGVEKQSKAEETQAIMIAILVFSQCVCVFLFF